VAPAFQATGCSVQTEPRPFARCRQQRDRQSTVNEWMQSFFCYGDTRSWKGFQGVWLGNVNGNGNVIRKRCSQKSVGFDPAKKIGRNRICTGLQSDYVTEHWTKRHPRVCVAQLKKTATWIAIVLVFVNCHHRCWMETLSSHKCGLMSFLQYC
jgi:hypothetical protein